MSITDKIDMFLGESKKELIVKKKGSGYESWTYYMKGATRGGRDRSHSPITMKNFNSVADAQKWGKKNGWSVRIVESIDESMKGYPKVKGWEIEADDDEVDYYKEVNGNTIHLVFNDMDFPTDASAIITYGGEGSKKSKSTSFDVKSTKDIPNVLRKVEKWAKR